MPSQLDPHPLREMGLVAWASISQYADVWDVESELCLGIYWHGAKGRKWMRGARVVAQDVWRDLSEAKLIRVDRSGQGVLADAARREVLDASRCQREDHDRPGSGRRLLAVEAFLALLPIPAAEAGERIRPPWATNVGAYVDYVNHLTYLLRCDGYVDARGEVLRAAEPRDLLRQFVAERLDLDPTAKLRERDLAREWKAWLTTEVDPVRANAARRMGQSFLGIEVRRAIGTVETRYVDGDLVGIRLRSP